MTQPPQRLRLSLFTDAHEIGGAEIALATLAGALDPSIDVDVLGVDERVVERVAAGRIGATSRVVPEPRNVRDVRALRALRGVLRERSPHVFQANLNSPWSCRYAILVARSVPGLRRIAVEQLVMPMRDRRTRIVKRITSRMLDAHVAVGAASARSLEAVLARPVGSIRTIRNAVEDLGEPAPVALGIPHPLVGTLARLDPIKGLDVLVDTLVRLPEIHVVVAGDGPAREDLTLQARERGVADRFHLIGWKRDARDLLGEVDLFVLPSRGEGLPLSIAEAMLARRAVVATDVGSVAEIVEDGETGLLVAPDDVEGLAAAMAELLADEPRRVRMGTRGRERAVEGFTAPRLAADFERLYHELTGWTPAVAETTP